MVDTCALGALPMAWEALNAPPLLDRRASAFYVTLPVPYAQRGTFWVLAFVLDASVPVLRTASATLLNSALALFAISVDKPVNDQSGKGFRDSSIADMFAIPLAVGPA